jgi:hypothetical protein
MFDLQNYFANLRFRFPIAVSPPFFRVISGRTRACKRTLLVLLRRHNQSKKGQIFAGPSKSRLVHCGVLLEQSLLTHFHHKLTVVLHVASDEIESGKLLQQVFFKSKPPANIPAYLPIYQLTGSWSAPFCCTFQWIEPLSLFACNLLYSAPDSKPKTSSAFFVADWL